MKYIKIITFIYLLIAFIYYIYIEKYVVKDKKTYSKHLIILTALLWPVIIYLTIRNFIRMLIRKIKIIIKEAKMKKIKKENEIGCYNCEHNNTWNFGVNCNGCKNHSNHEYKLKYEIKENK